MPKRKTHNEFVDQMTIKNPNIIILGTYTNSQTKILCKCKIDDNEWLVTPSKLLEGRGCPECGKRTVSKKMSKSHDQFVKELSLINPNIEVLGKYINSSTKILVRCKIDGNEWLGIPGNLINGRGCPKCKSTNTSLRMRYTHEYVEQLLKNTYPNIIMLENYKGHHIKIKFKCLICNTEWSAMPTHVLHGKWLCPTCGKIERQRKVSHNFDYVKNKIEVEFSNILGIELKIIDSNNYKTGHTKMTIIDSYGYKYYLSYSDCYYTVCRNGYFLKFHSSNIYTIENLNLLFENTNYPWRCIDGQKYINYFSELEIQHIDTKVICKKAVYAILSNVKYNQNKIKRENRSIGEQLVYEFLTNNTYSFIEQHTFDNCKYVNKLRYDFYLEEYNLLIEVQGKQHYEPVCFGGISKEAAIINFELQQLRDNAKREYCKKYNIELLEIPYWEFNNIKTLIENITLKQAA